MYLPKQLGGNNVENLKRRKGNHDFFYILQKSNIISPIGDILALMGPKNREI